MVIEPSYVNFVFSLIMRNALGTYSQKAERSVALFKEAVALTAAKINEARSAVSSAHGLTVAQFDSSSGLATEISRIILLVGLFRPVAKSAQRRLLWFREFVSSPTDFSFGC